MCPSQPDNQSPAGITPQTEPEASAAGVFVEWLEDRRIVVFKGSDSSRATMQALFDRAEAIIQDWPGGRPFLAILDFSHEKLGGTPYARQRAKALITVRPELHGALSLLMASSIPAQFLQMVTRTVQRPDKLVAVYFTRDEAIAWLKKVGNIR